MVQYPYIEMVERDIQKILYKWLTGKQHTCIIPNISLALGEADLISLSKGNMLSEYEIKLSRADFLTEFRVKKAKHATLSAFCSVDNSESTVLPSYYWLVCLEGVAVEAEIPEYAGFIEIDPLNLGINVVKGAPSLHKQPVGAYRIARFHQKMMRNFWNLMEKGYILP